MTARPDHIMALVGDLMDEVRRTWLARTEESGGLRPSQFRMLSLTPADGMRVTDLADLLGVTKQSLGELATGLEQRGLLESVRDPDDRRVRVLRPTAAGRDAVAEGERLMAEIEDGLRARVGAQDWQRLRDILGAAVTRPEGT